MAFRSRTSVPHDFPFNHVPPARRRPVERSALRIPLEALGPVSDVIELLSDNITMRPVDPERDEENIE